MASFEKRTNPQGETSYRVKVRLKGHPTESATFERLTDAKRWGTQTEAAIREGRYFRAPEGKRHTLADAIARYRREFLPRLKDAKNRGRLLDWWEANAGALMLADLTPAKITEFLDRLKVEPIPSRATKTKPEPRYRTPATVNRYKTALSPVFTACTMGWGWLESNPAVRVKSGQESRGRVRFLSNEERAALLQACNEATDTPELKVIVLLAITTGARRGEIIGLRWRDVDMTRKSITLHDTKNGETRAVPLVGVALDAMREWGKVRPLAADTLVFPGRSARTKDKPLIFETQWQSALKRAGIEGFRFHDLRHTAASYLAMNGAGLREIADILGHKTLAMVQRYSHLTQDHKIATVERMAAAMFGTNP
ncbi:site-specific integrase [Halothiobacillus sp.]|uniref:tyrosine-type recombinase/integrase n=1 Tax=Halothiobacillus sp. TaxID=1891311 RepID=UPI002AD566B1|nr:site-specific integrase [Halothiobacillus sp.]